MCVLWWNVQPWSGVVIQRHGSVRKSRKKSFLVRNSYDDKQKAPEKTEREDRLILSLLVDSVRRKLIQLFFFELAKYKSTRGNHSFKSSVKLAKCDAFKNFSPSARYASGTVCREIRLKPKGFKSWRRDLSISLTLCVNYFYWLFYHTKISR